MDWLAESNKENDIATACQENQERGTVGVTVWWQSGYRRRMRKDGEALIIQVAFVVWKPLEYGVRMASHSLLEQLTCCCLHNVHWSATWKNWSLRLLISLARKTPGLQSCVVHEIQFCLSKGRAWNAEVITVPVRNKCWDGQICYVHWEWLKEPIRKLQGLQWG